MNNNCAAAVSGIAAGGARHNLDAWGEQVGDGVMSFEFATPGGGDFEGDFTAADFHTACVFFMSADDHVAERTVEHIQHDEDDYLIVTFQVDGTHGSAVAGLTECVIQPRQGTPRPVWNPDIPQPINFYEGWQKMPEQMAFENGFKAQWELFLRHVVEDAPHPHDLWAGARGVQLAELGLQSAREGRRIEVPAL